MTERRKDVDFNMALSRFLELLKEREDERMAKDFPILTPGTFSVDPGGKKYLRVVMSDPGSRCAFCFVERATGNILKPDGWKRPARHARGNIFALDPLAGTTPYGVMTLR